MASSGKRADPKVGVVGVNGARGPRKHQALPAKKQASSAEKQALPAELDALLRVFGRHLSAGRGLSPHTVRAYVGDATSLLGHVARCGIEDVADIDVSVIRAWLATQHVAGQSRASIARRAASARALTGFAHERGLLGTDPGALLGTLKTRRELPEVLAVDEVLAVLGDRRGQPADTRARQLSWRQLGCG